MKPTQILARICKDENLDGPHYTAPGKCRVENMIFAAAPTITDEAGSFPLIVFLYLFRLFCQHSGSPENCLSVFLWL